MAGTINALLSLINDTESILSILLLYIKKFMCLKNYIKKLKL